MDEAANPPRVWYARAQLRWLIGGGLLVAAPLLVFLRTNLFLNGGGGFAIPSFPIDDGYIYSNYAQHAADGQWFSYQDGGGEISGGVTSLLWYLLLTPTYAALRFLLGFSGLGAADLLAIAAYLLGAVLLAASGGLMFKLADLLIAPLLPPRLASLRPLVLSLPPLLLLLLTPQATWAALSGLEIPLSIALVLAALYTILRDLQAGQGPGGAAAISAGLLAWARPELAAVAGLLVAVALGYALRHRATLAAALRYLLTVFALGGLLVAIYWLGTGRPLPASFYAKSGQLALFSPRFTQAVQQLIADGGWPFLALFAVAMLTALLVFFKRHNPEAIGLSIVGAALALHTVATSAATVWYGQMERYLLPVYPLALLLVVALPVAGLRILDFRFWILEGRKVAGLETHPPPAPPGGRGDGRFYLLPATFIILVVAGILLSREAATGYAVQARNIAQAHIAPARWLVTHTPPDTLVATEPVGALRLFSARPTLDIVGLTTPAMLGHYRDWDYTWRYLRQRNAAYLLYYPQWFKEQGIAIPAWLHEAQRFKVEDNRIAGANEVVLYRLDWGAYK